MTTAQRGGLKGWWRSHVWPRLVLELGDAPFYNDPEDEMTARLWVKDDALAALLVSEAERVDGDQHTTAASIESRAMTLQGAVAIATTLTLAAAGLLLDPSKIGGHNWRMGFAAILAATVISFLTSGIQALRSSSQTYPWTVPGYNDIFVHATQSLSAARAAYAAAQLHSAGRNMRIVQVKGGYLNAAVFWFKVALGFLAILTVLVVAYAVFGSTPKHVPSTGGQLI